MSCPVILDPVNSGESFPILEGPAVSSRPCAGGRREVGPLPPGGPMVATRRLVTALLLEDIGEEDHSGIGDEDGCEWTRGGEAEIEQEGDDMVRKEVEADLENFRRRGSEEESTWNGFGDKRKGRRDLRESTAVGNSKHNDNDSFLWLVISNCPAQFISDTCSLANGWQRFDSCPARITRNTPPAIEA